MSCSIGNSVYRSESGGGGSYASDVVAQSGGAYLFWNLANPRGRAALDSEISRQALISAYANDYIILFWMALPAALLVLLMRRPARRTGPQEAVAVHAD